MARKETDLSSADSLPAFVTDPKKRGTSKPANKGASDMVHVAVVFDDNHRARTLFGQYDEHLAIIERDLHLEAAARGNEVNLRGSAVATDQARRVLDILYARIESGEDVAAGDVEGAIKQAIASDAQMTLPTMEKKGKLAMAAISTAKRTIHARTYAYAGRLHQGDGSG